MTSQTLMRMNQEVLRQTWQSHLWRPSASRQFAHDVAGAVMAAHHIAIGILEETELDALTCLDFPPSNWKRLHTHNVQERVNRKRKRRPRMVQIFPSTASHERLAGTVMLDMDEEWQDARYFSKAKMDELFDEARAAGDALPPTEDEREGF